MATSIISENPSGLQCRLLPPIPHCVFDGNRKKMRSLLLGCEEPGAYQWVSKGIPVPSGRQQQSLHTDAQVVIVQSPEKPKGHSFTSSCKMSHHLQSVLRELLPEEQQERTVLDFGPPDF
jgi:hypothetical protein